MKLEELKVMMDSGRFHHATYRDIGTIWEGLMVYEHDSANGFRGFKPAAVFGKTSPDLKAAEEMVARTGVSVGSYGNG